MKINAIIFLLVMSTCAYGQYIPKFDVQGHRGARGLKPENSIPGFITALDSGVTTIEMDVVITGDRQVVLSHEPYISATICLDSAGKPIGDKEEKKLLIYHMRYDQLQQFDCGSKDNPKFPRQAKMKIAKPLLGDVISAVEDHIRSFSRYEVDYNIEIKSTPEGDGKSHPGVAEFSELVFATIDEYLPMDRVVIQSFDFRVLKYWHQKHPEVRLAALVENMRSIDSNLNALGFNPSVYSPYFKLINKENVKALHKKKIRVIPWTVNEIGEMLSMKGMGVDGFITDYPDRARRYKMTLNIQHPANK